MHTKFKTPPYQALTQLPHNHKMDRGLQPSCTTSICYSSSLKTYYTDNQSVLISCLDHSLLTSRGLFIFINGLLAVGTLENFALT